MQTNKYIFIILAITWLAACSEKTAEAPATAAPVTVAPTTKTDAPIDTPPAQATMHKAVSENPAQTKERNTSDVNPIPGYNPEKEAQRIDAYLGNLKIAAYAFNPPSPIFVDKPTTVHLWLDPQVSAVALAQELKKLVPRDAARVESGKTKWSPQMRATLSGEEFKVIAIDPEVQLVSLSERTRWSWDITPLSANETLSLHLRLEVIFPSELGVKTITTLDREIYVEATWWWLFDHYFDKYWKWLLGGLGTTIASIVVWWWNIRRTKNNETGHRTINKDSNEDASQVYIKNNRVIGNEVDGSLTMSSYDSESNPKKTTIEGNELANNTVKGDLTIGVKR